MMTRRHFALASAAALASGAAGSLSAAPIPKDFDTVFPSGQSLRQILHGHVLPHDAQH